MNGKPDKSDNKLIEEFKSGSENAFDELVVRYASRLFQLAYGLLGNRQDAEEVVQDAFVRIYKFLDTFRGDASFSTWIYRIAINLSRNKYHWNRRRGIELNISLSQQSANAENEQKGDWDLSDTSLSPDKLVQEEETERSIMNAVDKLPGKLKEAIMLRHVGNLCYEEIAQLLDCRIGTVKSRIARAREILRKVLKM